MTQKNTKAIVTIAIGDDYVANLHKKTLPTWHPYCERHGYDLVVITEPIDKSCDFSRKSFHWQKLLIGMLPQLQDYERLVWLDGDILINHRMAPCIVAASPADKVGAIAELDGFHTLDLIGTLHTRFLILNYLQARSHDPKAPKALICDDSLENYYASQGLQGSVKHMINTGVFVFDPKKYGPVLGEIYMKFQKDFLDFENTPYAFELQDRGIVQFLDERFNAVWSHTAAKHYPFLFNPETLARQPDLMHLCANTAFQNAWFMHFAGGKSNPVTKKAFDVIDDAIEGAPAVAFQAQWQDHASFLRTGTLMDNKTFRDSLSEDEARTWANLM